MIKLPMWFLIVSICVNTVIVVIAIVAAIVSFLTDPR
jgi:hypothetical protein